eukprot:10975381-Karenia_brevis.AAC.1
MKESYCVSDYRAHGKEKLKPEKHETEGGRLSKSSTVKEEITGKTKNSTIRTMMKTTSANGR